MFVEENVRVAVARGEHDWITLVEECAEDFSGEVAPEEIRALATRHFAAHLEAQVGWPRRTDSDRLTDAFRALDAAGITARQDFSCCQNCGVAELRDAPGRGFVFYHQQDAERAAGGGSLWLAFGPDVEAGREVVAALRAEGLHVDWDESAGQRIHVRLRWARPRYGRMAAHPSEPGGREIGVEVVRGRHRVPGRLPAAVLGEVELPWLPAGVELELTDGDRTVAVHREFDRLIGDGRAVGRFDGLRLLADGEIGEPPAEAGLIEVTYQTLPGGPAESAGRPMTIAEVTDVLRRLPTRTGSWLSAVGRSGGCVQVVWEEAGLWLETPDVEAAASVGKHTTLDDAERMLGVLADEDRVAVRELPGVISRPW
ncbi:DUF6891 domain-containing protein [Actinoplanes flavus]|uniref:DUF6891 domain-containing protein n=1 Tax=Actinoplanes flavus TaxID=2820290 RepID=A0ABS3UE64_9ACTN|nr:hypothetical protein [Actinoplanes flavus]MBO3737079.1 hypothetical protein [Actinoplanes flavus]